MQSRFSLLLLAAATIVAGLPCRLDAAEGAPDWLTGAAFRKRLAAPATVIWFESALRESLFDFARAQKIAVVLDRRVDPDQRLELSVRAEPVFSVLQKTAESRGLRASVLGSVVYVGPTSSAEKIRTVAELRRRETAALEASISRKFAEPAPLAWEDLDTPRALLESLAAENGLEIVNLDRVPHDLWPASDLPPLPLVERLTLILHQFGLTFRVAGDGRRIAVVPIPRDVAIVRDYPAGAEPARVIEKWRGRAPRCEFRVAGDRIYVRGLVEDHETLKGTRPAWEKTGGESGRSRAGGPLPPQVFTVEVPNRPLGNVLTQLARQLGLTLRIDRESLEKAGVSLDQLVTFRVEEADLDELFRAALAPVGCVHRREGNVLRIWAREGGGGSAATGKNRAKGR